MNKKSRDHSRGFFLLALSAYCFTNGKTLD